MNHPQPFIVIGRYGLPIRCIRFCTFEETHLYCCLDHKEFISDVHTYTPWYFCAKMTVLAKLHGS